MCGIIGYIGDQQASPFLIEGLRRLEYRGYDSSGIAVKNGEITVHKRIGKVADLESAIPKKIEGTCGIAHTRWGNTRWCHRCQCSSTLFSGREDCFGSQWDY